MRKLSLLNIFRWPDAYQVAYAGVPVSDLVQRMGYKSQGYRNIFAEFVGKQAVDDPMEYRRRSPYFYADKLATPLLVHTNTNDEKSTRTPRRTPLQPDRHQTRPRVAPGGLRLPRALSQVMKEQWMKQLTLLCVLFAVACVNETTTTSTNAPHAGPVRIGFSMDTLKEERWQRDKELVEQRAKQVGAVLDVQVANGDDAEQTKQADNMLTKGVDVLIVAPHNGEIAASIVEAAHRKGVPVIAYDRLIRNADVDLYISHQVVHIGEMQGEYALQHVPKGNYVLIGGSPTDYNAILLHEGQMKILKPAIDRGDIKVVSDQYAREWKAEEALRLTEDALTKTGNNIQAIVASNDGTAGGAVSALEAAGLAGKVLVTGQDAQKDALQRIVKGTQTMTIYKPIQPLAFGAVDAALELAHKQKVNAPDKINNGKKDVPAILIAPIAVDKSNIDATVIKDGYHTHAEIYGQ